MDARDLLLVVADLDAENAIKTLLTERQPALQISLTFRPTPPPLGDLLRYAGRDAGCYLKAVELLRPFTKSYRHALIVFDHHGSGKDACTRDDIEAELETQLCQNGWNAESVAVVVIAPELEAWIWSTSPHVAERLGWKNERESLKKFLATAGHWHEADTKPHAPKEALEAALGERRETGGPRLFADLAQSVGLTQCEDPSFVKFRTTLQKWFPTAGPSGS